MLPEKINAQLQEHLERVKTIHARDLNDGYGRVPLPCVEPKVSQRFIGMGLPICLPTGEAMGQCENRRTGSSSRRRIDHPKVNQGCGATGRDWQAGHIALVETFLRDAFARGWV
jgi:hypothetical protein